MIFLAEKYDIFSFFLLPHYEFCFHRFSSFIYFIAWFSIPCYFNLISLQNFINRECSYILVEVYFVTTDWINNVIRKFGSILLLLLNQSSKVNCQHQLISKWTKDTKTNLLRILQRNYTNINLHKNLRTSFSGSTFTSELQILHFFFFHWNFRIKYYRFAEVFLEDCRLQFDKYCIGKFKCNCQRRTIKLNYLCMREYPFWI